jgi:hypothetical protein
MKITDLPREALERIVSELLEKYEVTVHDVVWDNEDVAYLAYELLNEYELFAELEVKPDREPDCLI